MFFELEPSFAEFFYHYIFWRMPRNWTRCGKTPSAEEERHVPSRFRCVHRSFLMWAVDLGTRWVLEYDFPVGIGMDCFKIARRNILYRIKFAYIMLTPKCPTFCFFVYLAPQVWSCFLFFNTGGCVTLILW